MQLVTIDDIDDPRIEPYRAVRERDVAGREDGFILEGEVVLRAFAKAGRYELASVLLAQKRVEKLMPVLAMLPAAPIYARRRRCWMRLWAFRSIAGCWPWGGAPSRFQRRP